MKFLMFLCIHSCKSLMVPVAPTGWISKNKPFKVSVLGEKLVFWKQNSSFITGLRDICPHRFAQLSKGVITPQKKLKCGYHGIEYNEVGKATLIPHSKKNKCDGIQANKFETATNFELTWVNIDPEGGTRIFNMTNHDYSMYNKRLIQSPWYMETVSLPYEFVLENTIDMLHVENVHHGKLGLNRYKILESNKYDHNNYTIDYFDRNGFRVRYDDKISVEFMAPFHSRVDFIKKKGNISIVTFCVPNNVFKTNFMARVIYTPRKKIKHKFFARVLNFILKITTTKKLSKSILDQDVHQISGVVENKNFTQSGYDQFTPGDFPVILMKKWFKAYA